MNRSRNAVNGDSFGSYFHYFNLSSVISATANSLFMEGKRYSIYHQKIFKLMEFYKETLPANEQFLNNQIQQKRQLLEESEKAGNHDSWSRVIKPQCVRDVEYWENVFQSHLTTLNEVIATVDQKLN